MQQLLAADMTADGSGRWNKLRYQRDIGFQIEITGTTSLKCYVEFIDTQDGSTPAAGDSGALFAYFETAAGSPTLAAAGVYRIHTPLAATWMRLTIESHANGTIVAGVKTVALFGKELL